MKGLVDGMDAFPVVSPPRASGRRRMWFMAGGIALALGLTAAALALVMPSRAHHAGSGTVVLDAVRQLAQARTADVSMNIRADSPDGSLVLLGTGAVDFGNQEMQADMSASLGYRSVQIPVVVVSGIIYEALPGLSQLEPGKTWMSMDSSALSARPSVLGVGGNPAVLLDLIAHAGAKVAPAGASNINGVSVKGYYVEFSQTEIRQLRSDKRLAPGDRAALSEDITDLSGDLQLDHAGRLVEDTLSITVGSPQPMVMSETVDYSHIGTSVHIAMPPPNQVVSYEKVMRDAGRVPVQVI